MNGLFGTKCTPLHRRPAGWEKEERGGRPKKASLSGHKEKEEERWFSRH